MLVRNVSQAKVELPALVDAVQNGSEVIITESGKPVAKIIRYRGSDRPRMPGSLAGQIWIAPDFDTLPDDIASHLGMEKGRG